MSSKLITDIINDSNGDIDADFFINANLTEIVNLLEENEGSLDTMKWVGKTFECYSTNRFIGVETEKELENLAQTLNADGSFFAGIFVSLHSKLMIHSIPHKVKTERGKSSTNITANLPNRLDCFFLVVTYTSVLYFLRFIHDLI